MAYKRLGDILIDAGMITDEQLSEALAKSKETKKRLGETLIDDGLITERQLIEVLCSQLGIDFIDLSTANIPTTLASLVPKSLATKYEIIPVKLSGDTLQLAMVDPLNFTAIEDARLATKKRIQPMIATGRSMTRAIAALYGNESASRAIEDMQQNISSDEPVANEVVTTDEESSDAAPAIRLVNSIIERAANENASDIHIEPRENGLEVRMRIDGVLHQMLKVPKELQNSVISRVKIMGNMDISERRIPQDGRSNIHEGKKEIDVRISTLPTYYGEKIVMRLLDKSGAMLSKEGIGLYGDNLEKYESLIKNSNGVILIVGPTGSGKSSTMYTMINDLASEEVNLVTLEDPIEYNMDGVNQVQINDKTGMNFASGLRSILRQDPDIIGVGEIRDGETAEIAMRAAITGHLVLSTIHTNDAVSTLDRLVDIGVEPYIISSALKGVISQRLVRKICPHCKKPYSPSEEERELLGIKDPDAVFYKGIGCSECLGTGYRGRTAVFEILIMTKEVKRAFRKSSGSSDMESALQESGFVPLIENCRKLVLEGKSTCSEVLRILNSTDD